MLRSVPSALDPGARPSFTSAEEVATWVQGVDWLIGATGAVVLHLQQGTLTCMASTSRRVSTLGPSAWDVIAEETIDCTTSEVIVVDVRRKLSPKLANQADHRRHRQLRVHLAARGVALLDTVIVAPDGATSVSGGLALPVRAATSELRVHVPAPQPVWSDDPWYHEDAPPGRSTASLWPLDGGWP